MIPLGNWADRIDELQSENYDLLQHNGVLEDEIAELLYQRDGIEQRSGAWWEAAKEAVRQRNRVNRTNDTLRESRDYWCARADNLMDQLDATVTERDHLRARLEELEKEFRDYKVVHAENEYQLDEWRKRAEQAEDRINALKRERDAWQGAHDMVVDTLRRRDEQAKERAEAEKAAESWEASFLALEHAYDELQASADQTKALLEGSRVANNALRKLLREAEQRAAAHWETAKRICRIYKGWREEYLRVAQELSELKRAMRTLSEN